MRWNKSQLVTVRSWGRQWEGGVSASASLSSSIIHDWVFGNGCSVLMTAKANVLFSIDRMRLKMNRELVMSAPETCLRLTSTAPDIAFLNNWLPDFLGNFTFITSAGYFSSYSSSEQAHQKFASSVPHIKKSCVITGKKRERNVFFMYPNSINIRIILTKLLLFWLWYDYTSYTFIPS